MSRSRCKAQRASVTASVRDVKVERIGRVTIYLRGENYWVYYREGGQTVRQRIRGNLSTARSTASRINTSLVEKRPTAFGFERKGIGEFLDEYLDHGKVIKNLSPRTIARYRAALDHFRDFAEGQPGLSRLDQVTERTVEEFVRFLRGQRRTRNGSRRGKKREYADSGIWFILAGCRTAFLFAQKRRYLPPFEENPFSSFPLDRLKARQSPTPPMLTPEQLRRFFETCDDWQFRVFFVLALYGLRVGELTHLLISDVDLAQDLIHIRPKPDMYWTVKTQRERLLPILPQVKTIIESCIGDCQEGFLFLHRGFTPGGRKRPKSFRSRAELRRHLEREVVRHVHRCGPRSAGGGPPQAEAARSGSPLVNAEAGCVMGWGWGGGRVGGVGRRCRGGRTADAAAWGRRRRPPRDGAAAAVGRRGGPHGRRGGWAAAAVVGSRVGVRTPLGRRSAQAFIGFVYFILRWVVTREMKTKWRCGGRIGASSGPHLRPQAAALALPARGALRPEAETPPRERPLGLASHPLVGGSEPPAAFLESHLRKQGDRASPFLEGDQRGRR